MKHYLYAFFFILFFTLLLIQSPHSVHAVGENNWPSSDYRCKNGRTQIYTKPFGTQNTETKVQDCNLNADQICDDKNGIVACYSLTTYCKNSGDCDGDFCGTYVGFLGNKSECRPKGNLTVQCPDKNTITKCFEGQLCYPTENSSVFCADPHFTADTHYCNRDIECQTGSFCTDHHCKKSPIPASTATPTPQPTSAPTTSNTCESGNYYDPPASLTKHWNCRTDCISAGEDVDSRFQCDTSGYMCCVQRPLVPVTPTAPTSTPPPGATATPTIPGGVGGPGGGGGGATVAPPQKPSGGFCADSIRKNAMALETPAACDPANIDNNTELVAGTGAGGVNKWCDLNHHAGSYFYRCTNSSSNPTPGAGGPFNPATVTNKGLSCSGTSVIIRPSYTPGNAATYIFAVWKDSPPPGPTEFTTNTEYTVASPLLDGSHTIYFDIMSCPEGTNELNPAHNPHCSYSKNGIYSIGGQELKDQATTCAAGTGGGATPPAGATSTPAPTPSGGGAATGSVCNSNNNFACSNSSAVCSIHWDCTTTSQQSLPHGCCATGRWCPSANACVSFGTPCAACAVVNTTPGATGTGCAAPNPTAANRGYDCPDVYHSGTCGGGMTCQAEVGSRTGCTCQPGRQIYPTETPRPGTATPTPHATPTPAPVGPSGATCVAEGNSGRCGGTEVDPRAYTSWGQVPPCTNGQYCWVRN